MHWEIILQKNDIHFTGIYQKSAHNLVENNHRWIYVNVMLLIKNKQYLIPAANIIVTCQRAGVSPQSQLRPHWRVFPDRSAAYFQCTEVHTSMHFNDAQCIEVLHCNCTANALQLRCISIWVETKIYRKQFRFVGKHCQCLLALLSLINGPLYRQTVLFTFCVGILNKERKKQRHLVNLKKTCLQLWPN